MKKFVSLLMCICMLLGIAAFAGCGASNESAGGTSGSPQASEGTPAVSESEKEALREKLKAEFLSEADKVVVTEDAVTFTDAFFCGREQRYNLKEPAENGKSLCQLYYALV